MKISDGQRLLGVLGFAVFVGIQGTRVDAQTLGLSGNRFTVDGVPRFLVFASYFDAMDVPDGGAYGDFGQLRAWGVDGIRIFPNWWTYNNPNSFAGDTIIAPDGTVRDGPFYNMVWYLDRAREYGLLVDLSFSGETVSSCADCAVDFNANDLSFSGYLNGVREVAARLAGPNYRHVLFDIQNESNINGPWHRTPLSDSDVAQIVQAVKSVDPGRIVTASVDQTYPTSAVASRANGTSQDAATWHEPRDPFWWDNTRAWLQQIRNGTGKPIYLQEPERYRPGQNDSWFTADNLRRAVKEAKNGCAAAWTFHTSASFHMNGSSLLAGLQPVESDFLSTFSGYLNGETWCQ